MNETDGGLLERPFDTPQADNSGSANGDELLNLNKDTHNNHSAEHDT